MCGGCTVCFLEGMPAAVAATQCTHQPPEGLTMPAGQHCWLMGSHWVPGGQQLAPHAVLPVGLGQGQGEEGRAQVRGVLQTVRVHIKSTHD